MIHNKFHYIGNLGYKIALFSDIHYDIKYDLTIFKKIINNLKENKPDFICLAGDIIDYSLVIQDECMNEFKKFIKEISLIAPTIITLGNHDISYKINHKRVIGNIEAVNSWFLNLNTIENVYYLYNKSIIKNELCFTGYNPPFKYYGARQENTKLFASDIDDKINLKPSYYNILLCHSPINVFKPEVLKKSKQIKKADLILSGHMHNGLVFKLFDKKGNKGFVSPYKTLFPKYARGLSSKKLERKQIYLVVSGGVVKLSNTNSKLLSCFNKLYPISVDYIII